MGAELLGERVWGLPGSRRRALVVAAPRPLRRREKERSGLGRLREAMAFTLYSLLQAALLCVNAIAVLHEERFLKNSE